MTAEIRYLLPPRLHTAEGHVRRVGVEIELGGLTVPELAELVRATYGGEIELEHRFSAKVVGTRLGDFDVELDSRYLEGGKHLELLERLGLDAGAQDSIEDAVEAVAMSFVPGEIAAPPIAVDHLGELDALATVLRGAGARGTRSAPQYAFGVHFNPEVPDLRAETLHGYLAAYLILADWLAETSEIDLARRVAPFIDPFPDAYRAQVIDPDYAPDLETLIADYLHANPTRNRGLDMTPVFAMIDADRVKTSVAEGALVKARPTLHYRLPNSEIDDPDWTIAEEWNRWIEVERLVEDTSLLAEMRRAFSALASRLLPVTRRAWAEEVERWIARAA